ncbi:MAG: aldehyde ferredoxin oxidoreductase N-terminal domain-containing protein, partial [Chloroflexota bacterium]|nr:aldehyde ferredoxin oxidoreductase N-terminal domain-containing protein [Chloroflexota bacterium]
MRLAGYAGTILRVDLTRGTIKPEPLSPEGLRDCLGGAGLGIKVLYDEVLPGTRWSDPENRLIVASGPLGGTAVPGSGTFSVATKGTLTNGATSTQANGFFGAYLRLSGFDAIVIQGQAPRLSYLFIEDGKAELRDASHLAGKDTWETTDALAMELGGGGDLSVASIGPAGENLVKFAGIFADKGHAAAHNGAGAVMGSKRLKAIAVRAGRQGIPLHDGKKLLALCQKMLEGTKNDPQAATGLYSWGTLPLFARFAKGQMYLPVKNYTTNIYPIDPQSLERFTPGYIRSHFSARPTPCYACPMHHSHLLTLPEGPYKGKAVDEPEYEGLAAWGSVTGQTDVVWAIYLADLVDRLGMDTNEAGWTMGLAMECYEKGLITREDTVGLELTWGNGPATVAMLRRIARREGFGDTMAEGAMRAAQRIGGEAPSFAIHGLKGNTPRGHDHRNAWGELIDTSVSSTGTLEVRALFLPESKGLKLADPTYPQETARL